MSFKKDSKDALEESSYTKQNSSNNHELGEKSIQKRVFYHPLNSLLGHSFVEFAKLQKNHETIIVGTCDENDESDPPEEVTKVFDKSMSQKDLLRVMADCDFIIFESLKTDINFLETVISHFETTNYLNSKTLLLISHPLIWCETRILKNSFLDSSETLPPVSFAKGDQRLSRKMKPMIVEPSKVTDNDFFERRTLPCYELHRLLENRIFSLNENNSSCYGSIVLPGLLFGRGEDSFYTYFEKLLQNSKNPFVCFGKGDNFIPMIYSMDLVERLFNMISSLQPLKNFYVFSNNENITQKQLLTEFAKILGQETVQESFSFDNMLDENYEIMTLNLQLQHSNMMNRGDLNSNKSQSLESISLNLKSDKKPFVSFIANFNQILNEFISYRNVQLTRMLMICPDILLETNNLLGHLDQELDVDIIQMEDLINQILDMPDTSTTSEQLSFKAEITNAIEQEREIQYQKQLDAYNQAKKAKKKNISEPVKSEIKIELFSALKEETFFKILYSQLKINKYKIRGFILVNAVTSLDKVQGFIDSLTDNCSFNDIQVMLFDFNKQKISTKITDLEIQLKASPKSEAIQKDLDHMRRLAEEFESYGYDSIPEISAKLTKVLFSDPKLIMETITTKFNEKETLIDANFEIPPPKISKQPSIPIQSVSSPVDNKVQTHEPSLNTNQNTQINNRRSSMAVVGQLNFMKQKEEQEAVNEEEAILNMKSASIKQYLADNVLPEITEGIIEICKDKPQNPVKFLVEFLKNKVAQNN